MQISRTLSLFRYNKGYFHEKVKTVTVIANYKIGRIFKYPKLTPKMINNSVKISEIMNLS